MLGHPSVWGIAHQFFGAGDGTLHPFSAGGEDELGTEHCQQSAALEGHGLGHGENQFVTLCGANKGESDPGIAASGLYDQGVGVDLTFVLGSLDHRRSDAILHATQWVEELTF